MKNILSLILLLFLAVFAVKRARLVTLSAGPDGVKHPGTILTGEEAERAVSAGSALWIEETRTAAIQPTETATKPKRTGTRRKKAS